MAILKLKMRISKSLRLMYEYWKKSVGGVVTYAYVPRKKIRAQIIL